MGRGLNFRFYDLRIVDGKVKWDVQKLKRERAYKVFKLSQFHRPVRSVLAYVDWLVLSERVNEKKLLEEFVSHGYKNGYWGKEDFDFINGLGLEQSK